MKIIRSIPAQNRYFEEEFVENGNHDPAAEYGIVNVFDEFDYQTVIGFGGAFTESAAYNYSLLTPTQKQDFLEKYFSREHGIAYNFGRTHINSCDFSLDIYAYVENGDKDLSTFSIDRERKYVIPFIKDAVNFCGEEIILFASPWSPPAYMKQSEDVTRGGELKEEYKRVWAHYYAKYVKAMAAEGVTISAITIQNEPNARQSWESCSYTSEEEREFIEQHLIPALDEEGLSDLKIMIWDHNKERVYDRTKHIFASQTVEERVWGVAHHWYSGDHFEGLRLVHERYNKPLVSTENCGNITADLLTLAERYGVEICEDFNNFTAAFCDWNLLLSEKGGPFHNRSDKTVACAGVVFEDKSAGCYAPVLYDTEKKELVYTPIYYTIGHFSKFVQRGAVRTATTKYTEDLHTIAFKNPDGSLVLVVLNTADRAMPVIVRHEDLCTELSLEPHAIMTVIL